MSLSSQTFNMIRSGLEILGGSVGAISGEIIMPEGGGIVGSSLGERLGDYVADLIPHEEEAQNEGVEVEEPNQEVPELENNYNEEDIKYGPYGVFPISSDIEDMNAIFLKERNKDNKYGVETITQTENDFMAPNMLHVTTGFRVNRIDPVPKVGVSHNGRNFYFAKNTNAPYRTPNAAYGNVGGF